MQAIEVDGKALRGSRTATTTYVTLLAAMDHTGTVRAQHQVADKSNEISAFAPLLDPLDVIGTVITADALHTQHARGTWFPERGAHYITQVKADHPTLFDRVRRVRPGPTSPSPTTSESDPGRAARGRLVELVTSALLDCPSMVEREQFPALASTALPLR
ncbi:ISAs1 family transposase [Streptomyces sp. NPDC002514]|uniref:ISAs1 family transposase n=1 Tax=Streptomyces sp. NPDC001270 TaxID=3364554 RepID=UPI003679372B